MNLIKYTHHDGWFTANVKSILVAIDARRIIATAFSITLVTFALHPAHTTAQTQKVVTQALADIAVYLEHSSPATVVSLNNSPIAAEINARVMALPVKIGAVVNKGDVLAELECKDFERRVSQSHAQLAAFNARKRLAQQQLKRLNKLVKSRNVSDDQLNQKQSELKVINAEIVTQKSVMAIADDRVAKCVVKSPYRGVVVRRPGQLGGYAMPGQALIELTDLDAVEVSAQISNSLINTFNDNTRFVLESQNAKHTLRLRTIVAVVDPISNTQEARFEFQDEKPTIGTSARLVWRDSQPAVLPEVIVQRERQLGVFIVSGNKAKFHVLPNALEGRPAQIDLALNISVVTQGQYDLQHDQSIELE